MSESHSLHRQRIPSITGVKVIAVLIIFLGHTSMFEGKLPSARMCELFFACSGILEAINHYGSYSYSLPETFDIAKRKYTSILPLYVTTFVIAAMLGAVGIGQWSLKNNMTAGLLNLLMLQPWFPSIQFSFNGVSWFIADLMLCYIVTPFLSYLLSAREQKARQSGWTVFFIPAVCFFFVRLLLQYADLRQVILIDTHCNPLARLMEYCMAYSVGSWLAADKSSWRDHSGVYFDSLTELFVILIYIIGILNFNDTWWSQPIFSVWAVVIVVTFVRCRGVLSRLLSLGIIDRFSAIQMPFYMFHQQIIFLITYLLSGFDSLAIVAASFVLTCMVSTFWHWFAKNHLCKVALGYIKDRK